MDGVTERLQMQGRKTPEEAPARSSWSLRARLLVSVGLVLLLPAILGIVMGLENVRYDAKALRMHLQSSAETVADPTENLLMSARQTVLAISNLPPVRDATSTCSRVLTSAVKSAPFLVDMARVDANGRIVCSTVPSLIGKPTPYQATWQEVLKRSRFAFVGIGRSKRTHKPVVIGALPYRDNNGRFNGVLGMAIDIRWLEKILRSSPLPADSVVALVDRNGNIIAATDARVVLALHGNGKVLAGSRMATLNNVQGKDWTYVEAALADSSIFLNVAVPETRMFGASYRGAMYAFVIPFVMIVLAGLAIWFVTERQLLRWITYLRRISVAYRGGDYALRPAMKGAPSELRGLSDAMAEMAASIQERDRSLRGAIEQKTLLIKEIHHRVKNNLQVVMSLLSLQAKELRDPAAKEALADARARTNALALVHRILYEVDEQDVVDLKPLLEQLADQTGEGFGAEQHHVRLLTNIVSRRAPSDTAVTVSLFAVEAMTNALKHAFPSDYGTIRVVLEAVDGQMLRLAVEDDGVGFEPGREPSGIGAKLMNTFGQQLGGKPVSRPSEGPGAVVEVIFPDPAQHGQSGARSSDQGKA